MGPRFRPQVEVLEDRTAPTVTGVSLANPALIPSTGSGDSYIGNVLCSETSANGQYAVYLSYSSNLVPSQTDAVNTLDVFLYSKATGTNTLVSHLTNFPNTSASGASALQPPSNGALMPSISADGRYVAYVSYQTNLVPGQVEAAGQSSPTHIFLYDRVTNTSTLVDHNASSLVTTGDQGAAYPFISADGNSIVYSSEANDLVAGEIDSTQFADNVYVYDRVSGTNTLVSHQAGAPATAANGGTNNASSPAISANGQFIAYNSKASNLVAGQIDNSASQDVFLYNRQANTSTLVSCAYNNPLQAVEVNSVGATISGDGRFVAYTSSASNLVASQTGAVINDVWLYDALSGTNVLVSHSYNSATDSGTKSSATTMRAEISADGSFVTYTSQSTSIVPGMTGDGSGTEVTNIFLYSRASGTNVLVDHTPGTTNVVGNVDLTGVVPLPAISQDGRYVAFLSAAKNLLSSVTVSSGAHVYVYDETTGLLALVDHSAVTAGSAADLSASSVEISPDGSMIAFVSAADDLVSGVLDNNRCGDVFLYSVAAQTNSVATLRAANVPELTGNAPSTEEQGGAPVLGSTISDDGRYVVYSSQASNLVAGEIDPTVNLADWNVYLFDRVTGTTTLVSCQAGLSATASNGSSNSATISGDGSWVAFMSSSTNLIAGQVITGTQVYLYNRMNGTTTLVTHASGNPNQGANGLYGGLIISTDGSRVAYYSESATNLVAGFMKNDSSTSYDAYLYDRPTNTNILVSHAAGAPTTTGNKGMDTGHTLVMSADGSHVAFLSLATNLVNGETFVTGNTDAYLFNATTGNITLVTHSYNNVLQGGNGAYRLAIDGNGGVLVFVSTSTNLVSGQGFASSGDMFVYTASSGNIVLGSHQPGSTNQGGNGTSDYPVISRDGSNAYFASKATNLVSGESDTNNATDIYGYNIASGIVTLVSHAAGLATTTASAQSDTVSTSANGQYVAFDSEATNLVSGYGNNKYSTGEDTYVYSVSTGAVQLASHAMSSVTAGNNQSCDTPFISADGNYVVFDSTGSNLVPGDLNEFQDVTNSDVFLYTREVLTVDVEAASGQPNPTNGSSVHFTVTFNEAVSNFLPGDVALSGTAGASTVTVTQTGGTTYDVAVSGMARSGTVLASVPPGVVQDSAGNLNAASVSANNVVGYNVSPPLVLSSLPLDPNPTTAASVNYTVVFSEPVTNVGAGDFQLTTISGNLSGTAITGVTALSGSAYLVTVSTGTGSGTLRLDVVSNTSITDLAGNPFSGGYSSGTAYSVNETPITLSPTNSILPGGTVNSAYAPVTYQASGGSGGFSFSESGTLPGGMSLSSAGTLSGAPTAAGTFVFIVTATDSSNDTDSQAYSLTVTNASATSLSGPGTVVSGQPATFTVSVAGSGPAPTGLVTLSDGSAIIASGQLNSGSVSFQSSTLTLGSHTLTAVYNGDTNYAGSTSPGLAVGVAAPNVSDSFGSGNGPLDSSWTVAPNPALTPAGSFAIQSAQAVATGPNFNSAIFGDFTPSDVGAGAFVDVSTATGSAPIYAGVQARLDNNGNSYVGLIASNGSSNLLILGLARGTGVLTFFSVVPIGATSAGNLRLEVFGTTLKLYLEGTLMASATDATLTAPGGVGLFSEAAPGAKYGGFFAYQLQASPAIYADGFSQAAVPSSTTLGAPWSVDQGGFTINASNQAVAVGVQSEATLYGASLTTVDESVSVIRAGTSAGLLVRWNSATQTGYELVMAGTTVSLYAVQNGTATLLNSATVGSGTGTLRLVVSGSILQAYFDGNSLFTVIDSTITGPGAVGLFSGGGSTFGTYTVTGS